MSNDQGLFLLGDARVVLRRLSEPAPAPLDDADVRALFANVFRVLARLEADQRRAHAEVRQAALNAIDPLEQELAFMTELKRQAAAYRRAALNAADPLTDAEEFHRTLEAGPPRPYATAADVEALYQRVRAMAGQDEPDEAEAMFRQHKAMKDGNDG